MDSDIDSPDPFGVNYKYSHMGRNFGHPVANMLMHGIFGRNLMPQPTNGQDMYDALMQRERSQHFMNLQSSSFSNNMLNQSLGISGPAAAMVGRMAGSPEGGLARMLSPMVGGNPMAASMQTYAGLSGASTMGAFGRIHSVSEEETQGVMNSLANNFYKTQLFGGKGGIAEELQGKNAKFLNSLVDKGDKASIKHLKDSGIAFEETKDGKIKDPEELKRSIAAIDVTSGSRGNESTESTRARDSATIKKMDAQAMRKDLSAATAEYEEDDDTSAEGKAKREAFKKSKQLAGGQLRSNVMSRLAMSGAEFDAKYMGETKSGEKTLLKDKLQRDMEKSTELNTFEKNRLESDQFGAIGFKRKGVNFENTRGFKLEDFTSGYAKAAELRMLGDSRGKSPEEMMDKFSKNAGGAMAAARSIFGNRSGGELMQKASDLMGVSSADMSSASGAKEVEDMLRKVKSTARVAGLSVKHMMGIIEATREMARNNPQLQHMNQGGLTNLAVASSMHAAAAGTQMSSADFRNAGAGQGIMAGETKSSLAFAQSGMGRLMAVALAQAKSRGKGDEMKKLIESGKFTPDALARGGYTEIAKVAGVTTGSLSYMASDPEVAARALKDKDTTDTVNGVGADKAVIGETMRMVSMGLFHEKGREDDLAKLYAQEKANGMTDEEFESKHIDPNLSTEQRAAFQTHKTKFFRGLRQSNMSPIVKNALTTIRDADAKASADTSKQLEGKTGTLASQAISAFMGGEGMDNIADALVGMFATSDYSPHKELIKKGQESAKGLYDSIRDKGKGSDKERIARIAVRDENGESDLSRINVVIGAQRAQALDTGDAVRYRQLQNITEIDVENLQKSAGVDNVEEAKARLKELRAREAKEKAMSPEEKAAQGAKEKAMTPDEQAALKARREKLTNQKAALEAREKLGGFASQSAYEAVNKGTIAGMAGGLLEGGKASAEKKGQEEIRAEGYKTLDVQLTELSRQEARAPGMLAKGDPSIKAAADYYADKGGARQLSEDLQKGKGFFDTSTEEGKRKKEAYANGSLGSLVQATAATIDAKEQQAKASGNVAPAEDTATAGLLKSLNAILDAITGSSSIKTAIESLTGAVGKL